MGKDTRTTAEHRIQQKKLYEIMQQAGIENSNYIQEFLKEMVGSVLENGLEGELVYCANTFTSDVPVILDVASSVKEFLSSSVAK